MITRMQTVSIRKAPQAKKHSSSSLLYNTSAKSIGTLGMSSTKDTLDIEKTEGKLQMTKQATGSRPPSLLSIKKQSLSFKNKKGLSLLERR